MQGKGSATFQTEHYAFKVPLREWEEQKAKLPEGSGADFIANEPVFARLMRPYQGGDRRPIYGRCSVGQEIFRFPFCEELHEFLDWLKQYGWRVFESWGPFCQAVVKELAAERGLPATKISQSELSRAIQLRYRAHLTGYYSTKGELQYAGRSGYYWSMPYSREDVLVPGLYLDHNSVEPNYLFSRYVGIPVLCVS